MTHADDVIRDCGDKVPTLQARMGTGGNQVPLVMYESRLREGQMSETDVCQTLASHMDNQTDLPVVLYNSSARDPTFRPDEKAGTITAGMRNLISLPLVLQENGNDRSVEEEKTPPLRTSVVPALCIRENTIGRQPQNGGNDVGIQEELSYTLTTSGAHGVATKARVRRLTPVECERLMGFPDDHTKVAYKGKDEDHCPDAPRYKACGNSMCVNVMQWIGERIEMVERGEL